MTVYEAIATGKRYRRAIPGKRWRFGPIVACTCVTGQTGPHRPDEGPCSLLATAIEGESLPVGFLPESLVANDYVTERGEEDFSEEAEKVINGLGLKIREPITQS